MDRFALLFWTIEKQSVCCQNSVAHTFLRFGQVKTGNLCVCVIIKLKYSCLVGVSFRIYAPEYGDSYSRHFKFYKLYEFGDMNLNGDRKDGTPR